MNIWTNDFKKFGTSRNICGEKISFDKKGMATVDDSIGKAILKVYKAENLFFKEEPKFEEPITVDTSKTDVANDQIATIKLLNAEIDKYKESLNRKRSEYDIVCKEFEEFKIQYDELQIKAKEAIERKEEVESAFKMSVDNVQIKYTLALKGLSGCKAVCRDMQLPLEDYKEQKDLEKLVDYIISKTENQ